jgi:hypothetical protein
MNQRLSRRMPLLELLFALFVSVVCALHSDEAGVIDWHHKLIGTPVEGSTFLHRPVAGSGALAYTLTDRDVLAALNLRDGAIGNDSNGTLLICHSVEAVTSISKINTTFGRMYVPGL